MVLAWTATIFRQFFDNFLSICLGESANRPESIFSLFFDHPLEPPPKPFFDYFCPVDPLGDTRSITLRPGFETEPRVTSAWWNREAAEPEPVSWVPDAVPAGAFWELKI